MRKKLNKKKSPLLDEIEQRRIVSILFVVALLFIILFVKLYIVMIVDSSKYKKKLDKLSYNTVEGSSAPRGRIYDRNHNILVDNIAVKTIYYTKSKKVSSSEEVKLAYKVSPHLNLDLSKLTSRAKREFYVEIHPKIAKSKIKDSEWEKLKQKKLDATDIKNLKIERITDDEINSMNDSDNKAAYLYYLMKIGRASCRERV